MQHYLIEYIGKRIRLSSDDKEALSFFDLLFSDMNVVEEPKDTDASSPPVISHIIVKRVESVDDLVRHQWFLEVERFFDSEYELKYHQFPVNSNDDLCFHLLDAVLYYFADNCYQGHLIHGACVSVNESSVLLPGSSGAGKTTLMTWLVKQGFAYQTDEMVYLNNTLECHAFRRSMQVKNHGFHIVGEILEDSDLFQHPEKHGIVKGQRFAILPWHLLNPEVGHVAPKLNAIIFPNYQKEGTFSLEPISQAQTAMELMGCHINARNLTAHGVPEVAAISRKVPAYKLTYQTFEQLEKHLLPLLRNLLND